jgi:hypothetical protein
MARMEHRRGEARPPRFFEQVLLDGRLADAVFAERLARLGLVRRHLHAMPVHPDRATMQEVADLAPERLDQLARALGREADQVHHRVGGQGADLRGEVAGALGGGAVHRELPHRFPRGVRAVRLAPLPADGDDLVPGFRQARHQV